MIKLEEFVEKWDTIYIQEQSTKIAGGFYKYFDNLDDCQEYMDENPDIFSKYGITKEILQNLYDISDGVPPFTINPNSKQIKLRRFFYDDDDKKSEILKLGNFKTGSKIEFRFKDASKYIIIGDGGLSVRAKSGSGTEKQELLTCDFIMNDKLDIDRKIEEYGLDSKFKLSVEEQVKKLKSFLGLSNLDGYEALRPTNSVKDPLIKELNRIYKMKNLFNGIATNIITPADIYLVSKKDKNDVIELLKTIDKNDKIMFNECKAIFLQLLNEKKMVPVSLKKIVKKDNGNEPQLLNVNKVELDIKKEFKSSITDNGVAITFNIDGHESKMNYRSNQNQPYPFTFEFNTKGSGGADGKSKTYLKTVLDENDIKVPSPKEYYDEYANKDYNWYLNYWKEHTQNLSIPNIDMKKPSKDIMNNDKLKFSFINCCLFIKLINMIWKNSEDEFYSFVGASYLFAKKISDYSLPYLLIK